MSDTASFLLDRKVYNDLLEISSLTMQVLLRFPVLQSESWTIIDPVRPHIAHCKYGSMAKTDLHCALPVVRIRYITGMPPSRLFRHQRK